MRLQHALVDLEPEARRVPWLDVAVHDGVGALPRQVGAERVHGRDVGLEDQAVGQGGEEVDVGGGRDHGVAPAGGAPEVPSACHVADLPDLADAAGLGAVGLGDRDRAGLEQVAEGLAGVVVLAAPDRDRGGGGGGGGGGG